VYFPWAFEVGSEFFLLDYGAPGGFEGLAIESAATVPIAIPAPAMKPIFIRMDLVLRCFAGAIATPAGSDNVLPLTLPCCAAAVPLGC
jgi:hypothetical protein